MVKNKNLRPPSKNENDQLSYYKELLSNHMKFTRIVEKFTDPNAAIRIGSSIINHNTTFGLDLVIDNCFVSFFPGIQAAYSTPRNPIDNADYEMDASCLSNILYTPEDGLNVDRISKSSYLVLISDEKRFLGGKDPNNLDQFKPVYRKIDQDASTHSHVQILPDDSGGNNVVANGLFFSVFPGVQAVYFMNKTAWWEEGESRRGNWSNWWFFFGKALDLGIITMQYAATGITWWTYDSEAYANLCDEFEFDNVQFKISPKEADFYQ